MNEGCSILIYWKAVLYYTNVYTFKVPHPEDLFWHVFLPSPRAVPIGYLDLVLCSTAQEICNELNPSRSVAVH